MNVTMSCINCRSSAPPSHLKHKATEAVSLSSFGRGAVVYPQRRRFSCRQIKALTGSVILDIAPPAKTGDGSVVLIAGGLLFFLYFVTNFVVPELIFPKSEESKRVRVRRKAEEDMIVLQRRSTASKVSKKNQDSTIDETTTP